MAQTWCRIGTCLRKFHSGRTFLSKHGPSRKERTLVKPVSDHSLHNTHNSENVSVLEPPSRTPLYVQHLAKSGKYEELLGEEFEDDVEYIPESLKSVEELKKSLEELEFDLRNLRELKKSLTSNKPKTRDVMWGTPDPTQPASNVPCGGCGSLFHCNDSAIPGYIPQEKFKGLLTKDLESTLCLRCHCMSNKDKILNIEADKAVYKKIVKRIRMEKALVLMVIDVTDITNSIIPDYVNQVGKIGSIVILGNKVDLIPKDQAGHLSRLKDKIWEECLRANLNPRGNNIKDIRLISAKTGYGMEDLITYLISYWKLKGNVYLVGTTNSGKSTLFNTFLESDYCKFSCRDIVQRATVSRWPGTTLNLVKFPIVKLRPQMAFLRQQRLQEAYAKVAGEREVQADRLRRFGKSNNAILFGKVGKTEFRSEEAQQEDSETFVPTGQQFVAYKTPKVADEVGDDIKHSNVVHRHDLLHRRRVLTEDYPESMWTYDTPGLINKNQIINFLTPQELKVLLNRQMIRPRVFVMKPGDTMFVTGFVRVDFIKGDENTPFGVFTNHQLPVHIVKQSQADEFYMEHIGTDVLGVPLGDDDRLSRVPSLCGRCFSVTTLDDSHFFASADIQLSSMGWLALAGKSKEIHLHVYTPGGRGMHLRQPALLPNLGAFMGTRKKGTKSYSIRKLKP